MGVVCAGNGQAFRGISLIGVCVAWGGAPVKIRALTDQQTNTKSHEDPSDKRRGALRITRTMLDGRHFHLKVYDVRQCVVSLYILRAREYIDACAGDCQTESRIVLGRNSETGGFVFVFRFSRSRDTPPPEPKRRAPEYSWGTR